VFWTPIERDWLAEQLDAILPHSSFDAAAGIPRLLEALPFGRRLGFRALVWLVAVAGRRSGVGALLQSWVGSPSWLRREVVSTLKVTATLVWEAEGGAAASGWGEGAPVVLPERRALLELPSVGTFAPQEVE